MDSLKLIRTPLKVHKWSSMKEKPNQSPPYLQLTANALLSLAHQKF